MIGGSVTNRPSAHSSASIRWNQAATTVVPSESHQGSSRRR